MTEEAREAKREYDRKYRAENRERIRERQRKWNAANKERLSEKGRKYQADNRERLRKQKRQYYAENRDHLLERSREYYAANRDRAREWGREYRKANRARILASQKKWYDNNRDYVRAYGAVRRHGIQPQDFAALWEAQGGRCYLCGDELDKLDPKCVHVDHHHSHCSPRTSCGICRRGLACNNCNAAIGYAFDDPSRLRRMADALEAANLAVSERKAAAAVPLALF